MIVFSRNTSQQIVFRHVYESYYGMGFIIFCGQWWLLSIALRRGKEGSLEAIDFVICFRWEPDFSSLPHDRFMEPRWISAKSLQEHEFSTFPWMKQPRFSIYCQVCCDRLIKKKKKIRSAMWTCCATWGESCWLGPILFIYLFCGGIMVWNVA